MKEVALVLAHDSSIVFSLALCPGDPLTGEIDLARFDRSVRSVGNYDGVVRRELVSLLVACIGTGEVTSCGVEIAQSEIGNVVFRISLGEAEEKTFGAFDVAILPRHVTKSLEGVT